MMLMHDITKKHNIYKKRIISFLLSLILFAGTINLPVFVQEVEAAEEENALTVSGWIGSPASILDFSNLNAAFNLGLSINTDWSGTRDFGAAPFNAEINSSTPGAAPSIPGVTWSAWWFQPSLKKAKVFRMRGTFTIPADRWGHDPNTISFKISNIVENSVNCNDGLLVFVHPSNVALNTSNYKRYYAFGVMADDWCSGLSEATGLSIQRAGGGLSYSVSTTSGAVKNALVDSNGGTTFYIDFINYNIAADCQIGPIGIKAVRDPGIYKNTITYNANGGTNAPGQQTGTHNSTVNLSTQEPTRTGYKFIGWTEGSTTGTLYQKGQAYYLTRDITMYAKWDPIYTVTYLGNGSTGGSTAAQTKVGSESVSIRSNGFTKTGHHPKRNSNNIALWNTAANGSGTTYKVGDAYNAQANLTLYAQWEPDTYPVTYNGNGATGGSTAGQTKTYGADLSPLRDNTFTKTGHHPKTDSSGAALWNTAANGSGTTYKAGGTYTKNEALTLYAQWDPDTYPVTYYANGGNNPPNSQTKTYGVNLTLRGQESMTRDGYTFNSWNTAADGSGTTYAGGATYTRNTALDLYAQWDPIIYHVDYRGNGNTDGNTEGQSKQWGTSVDINNNGFRKVGYSFIGWNTEPDGSGVSYTEGDLYSINQNLVLYAQWMRVVDVTFTKNWADESDLFGLRPDSLSITLYKGTGADKEEVQTVTITGATNTWTKTFENLPADDDDGNEIIYTIEENNIPHKYTGSGTATLDNEYTMTNTYVPEYISISGKKVWNDDSDFNGTRPDTITIEMLGSDGTIHPFTINKPAGNPNEWPFICTVDDNGLKLPRYKDGTEIVYVLTEPYQVFEYSQAAVDNGTTDPVTGNITGAIMRNDRTPDKVSVVTNKIWEDDDNAGHTRPESVDLTLIKIIDGVESEVETVTLSSENALIDNIWTYTWENMPSRENHKNITYVVREKDPSIHYTKAETSWNILNSTKKYTVHFEGNTSTSGEMSDQIKYHGTDLELSENSFTKTGWTFMGWNTEADGSGISYLDKDIYTDDADLTLYAQWEIRRDCLVTYIDKDIDTGVELGRQSVNKVYGTPVRGGDLGDLTEENVYYYNYVYIFDTADVAGLEPVTVYRYFKFIYIDIIDSFDNGDPIPGSSLEEVDVILVIDGTDDEIQYFSDVKQDSRVTPYYFFKRIKYDLNDGHLIDYKTKVEYRYSFDLNRMIYKVSDDGAATYDSNTDEVSVKNNLAGAQFEFIRVADVSGAAVVDEMKTAESSKWDGLIEFSGLQPGIYKLTETKAPDGYNKYDKDIYVKILPEFNEKGVLTGLKMYQGLTMDSLNSDSNLFYYITGEKPQRFEPMTIINKKIVIPKKEEPVIPSPTPKPQPEPVPSEPSRAPGVIKTVATVDGQKYINSTGSNSVVINDKVTFYNVGSAGRTYILRGSVFNKTKNDMVKDSTGNILYAELKYEYKEGGTVNVNIPLNLSSVSVGDTLVVYEELISEDGNVAASHKNPNDADQAVYVKGYIPVQTGVFPGIKRNVKEYKIWRP